MYIGLVQTMQNYGEKGIPHVDELQILIPRLVIVLS